MRKIHLDTDLGGDMDDVCALIMLLKYEDVEITGITTVAEENGRRAGYVSYITELAGRGDIPVAAGAGCLEQCRYQKLSYPEEIENWGLKVKPLSGEIDDALALLKKSIEKGSTIVGIGPYTNLYLLDKRYPGILKEANLVLMGGYIFPIRVGYPKMDFKHDWNIQFDIMSASYVLKNSNPLLVPLNITVETALKREHLGVLESGDELSKLISRQAGVCAKVYENEEKFGIINFLHDPLTVGIACGYNKDIEIKNILLLIEEKEGWLFENEDPRGKMFEVVTEIDGDDFSHYWLDNVVRCSEKKLTCYC